VGVLDKGLAVRRDERDSGCDEGPDGGEDWRGAKLVQGGKAEALDSGGSLLNDGPEEEADVC